MTMPAHVAQLIQTSLELEERDRLQRLKKSFTANGATLDGATVDALIKAGRRGVAILATHDGRFEVVPIGDTEATVREIPPGDPKPWSDAFEQISGEGWEKTIAQNRASRPPGSNPPIHQEGSRPTSDAARGGPMTAAKLQALNEEYRGAQQGQPVADTALLMRKETARADTIANNKRRVKEERTFMEKYAADAKAFGARL